MLLLGFASPLAAEEAPTDYVLGAEDVVKITIWGQGGISERFTIEGDGTFTFPILGRVTAGGLTPKQLQGELINRLRDGYFNDPRVTVVVEEYRSQHIFVIGEVKNPGAYPVSRPLTLIEALALAGSTTSNAGSVALIRRRSDGAASRNPMIQTGSGITEIRVDLTAIQQGILSENPILRDGDTIAVSRLAPIYVFGHVGRPGEYSVGKEATVRQVLALAGGISQRGAGGRIRIVRMVNGREQEIKAELDDRVTPGDTIVVPERYF
jgi:polysaccharide export outer membrane protein